jgi:tetratricopeptide (TPR) repeat protein
VGLTVVLLLALNYYIAMSNTKEVDLQSLYPLADYLEVGGSTTMQATSETKQRKPRALRSVDTALLNDLSATTIVDDQLENTLEPQKHVSTTTPSLPKKKVSVETGLTKNAALVAKIPPETKRSQLQSLKLIQAQVAELNMAIQHYSEGDKDESTFIDEKIASLEAHLNPENLMLLRMKAYWSQKRGNAPEALSQYRSILVINPDDMQASLNMVLLEISLGYEQRAKRRLVDLEDTYPNSMELVKFKQQVLAHLGT